MVENATPAKPGHEFSSTQSGSSLIKLDAAASDGDSLDSKTLLAAVEAERLTM